MRKNKLLSGRWLLTGGKIYNPYSDKFLKGDLLINNGKIEKIGKINKTDCNTIDCKGKIITSGFIDTRSHFKIPGSGYTETVKTGSMAAMAGGYTTVCVMSDASSPLDTPEQIKYVIETSKESPIDILPIGSVSSNHEGKELCEYGEMIKEGAVAFSDSFNPIQNSQFLRYALQYSNMYNKPIISYAQDLGISLEGIVNEGLTSTKLGLEGIPDIAESIIISRDLMIAEIVEKAKLHIPIVSAKKSLDVIKNYQQKKLNITVGTTPHHIVFNENVIANYNNNAKVYPPLRSEEDRKEIIKSIKNKIITSICSDHFPHSSEDKERDIKHSPFGTIALESAFSASYSELVKHNIDITEIIKLFTAGPRDILDLEVNTIEENSRANLTIIDFNEKWIFDESAVYSKSKNSIMLGTNLTSKIILTISGKNAFGYF